MIVRAVTLALAWTITGPIFHAARDSAPVLALAVGCVLSLVAAWAVGWPIVATFNALDVRHPANRSTRP